MFVKHVFVYVLSHSKVSLRLLAAACIIDHHAFIIIHSYFVSSALLSTAPPSQTEESPENNCLEQSDVDKTKQLSIRDIVELQETGFTVRIQPPGTESFELQVLMYYDY